MNAKNVICVAATAFLAACGGGDGGSTAGGDASTTPPQDVTPVGLWVGTIDEGAPDPLMMMVQGDGSYRALFVDNNNNTVVNGVSVPVPVGVFGGKMKPTGTQFVDTSSILLLQPVNKVPFITAVSLSGSFTPSSNLTGQLANSTTFMANYAQSDPLPDVNTTANWRGPGIGMSKVNAATQVDVTLGPPSGKFTGSSGSCTFSGSLIPAGPGNPTFIGGITFTSSECRMGNNTKVSISAMFVNGRMIVVGITDTTTGGLGFIAIKQ
ncbi:hypothetical protein [Burkholderia ubonensis]|uniref:hypothetical protein n=1 Tax=Burkholderia ubonensis TaxID=101571 RepID=UPI000A68ADB5|nr:hypothetical protein [Burkholderia ubonensis]